MIVGAVIGAIGSIGNRFLGIWEDREKEKREEKRRSDEIELAKIKGNSDTMVASFVHDSSLQEGISQWVANIRALVRPVLTFYSLSIITVFFFFAGAEGKAIILASLVEFSAMAGTWWFADRFRK